MKTLTIRNVPKRLADALDRERRRHDRSRGCDHSDDICQLITGAGG